MAATPLASMSKSSRLSASRSSSSPALGFGAAFLGAAAFFAFFFCGPFGPLFEPQLGGVQAASSSATPSVTFFTASTPLMSAGLIAGCLASITASSARRGFSV